MFLLSRSLARVLPLEPGPVDGFSLLKGFFFLPLLLTRGQDLAFGEVPGDIPDCNGHCINKVEMNGTVRSTIPYIRATGAPLKVVWFSWGVSSYHLDLTASFWQPTALEPVFKDDIQLHGPSQGSFPHFWSADIILERPLRRGIVSL